MMKSLLDEATRLRDFPALQQKIWGKRLVYLDSAATALKAKPVIDRITNFYSLEASNVHRGVHQLSAKATEHFEASREKVATFIGAQDPSQIIFTSGTTDSINLVAQSFGGAFLKEGDEVLITEMEHHSNIVPWQMLSERIGCKVRFVPFDEFGEFSVSDVASQISPHTKFLSITQCSNVLGTITPIKEIISLAHSKGIPVMVDGAQGIQAIPVDVTDLDCDFYAFSAHKLFGPFGVGVLYGKRDLLEKMPPYRGGGSMISEVTLEGTTYTHLPHKFEAGTPNISAVIAMAPTIDYVQSIGMGAIREHKRSLLALATERLKTIEGLRILGESSHKAAIISLVVEGTHPNDLADILDKEGIAARSGHHCTQPLHRRMGVSTSLRVSFSLYNTPEDVEALHKGLLKAIELVRP